MIVSTLFEKLVAKRVSGLDAGPWTTPPVALNCDPWHGHWNVWLLKPVMVHCSCVHTEVIALNVSVAARMTRNEPRFDWTSAAPPVAASGDVASTVTRTEFPEVVPLTVASCGTSLGEVVPLPPHAVSADARVPSDAT